jgi:hypothetical protein
MSTVRMKSASAWARLGEIAGAVCAAPRAANVVRTRAETIAMIAPAVDVRIRG